MTFVEGFGAADAGIGFEGDAAEEVQNGGSAAATEFVPQGVTDERANDGEEQREAEIHVAGSGEGPGSEQDGDSGYWKPQLLGGDPEEEDGVAVLDDEI